MDILWHVCFFFSYFLAEQIVGKLYKENNNNKNTTYFLFVKLIIITYVYDFSPEYVAPEIILNRGHDHSGMCDHVMNS